MMIRFWVLCAAMTLVSQAAGAASPSQRFDSTISACNDASLSISCLLVLETGGGFAIKAEARHNTGVYAITRSNRNLSTPLPFGFSVGVDSAVVGSDLSPNTVNSNQGVLGISQHATGAQGVTYVSGPNGNFGVFGADGNPSITSTNVGVEGIPNNVGVGGLTGAGAGVSGFARDTGIGVAGTSNGGFGVVGNSLDGTGVEAVSFARPALIASTVFGNLFEGFANIQGKPKEVASLDSGAI